MTKRRAPLSIDAALTRIAAQLPDQWRGMAEETGRRESLVRSWADPDRREQIPLRDAALLDQAYARSGGTGFPLLEWYTAHVGADQAAASSPLALGELASKMIRECGEANAATVLAAQPGAQARELAEARREIREAIEQLQCVDGVLARDHRLHLATGPP